MVQPLLDFCLNEPERVISIEVTDAQAKEGVVKVTIIIIIIFIVCHLPYHHISKTKIIIIWCLVCHWPPFACWARMWGCPCICLLVLLPSIIILLLMDNIFILMVIIIIFMVIIVVLMVMNMVSMNCWCYIDNYHIMITTSILCYQSTASHYFPPQPSCAGCLLWPSLSFSWSSLWFWWSWIWFQWIVDVIVFLPVNCFPHSPPALLCWLFVEAIWSLLTLYRLFHFLIFYKTDFKLMVAQQSGKGPNLEVVKWW